MGPTHGRQQPTQAWRIVRAAVHFYYQGGGADSVTGIPFAEAAFILDLLRNEKPMSYDHSLKRLSTYTPEPVGEAE